MTRRKVTVKANNGRVVIVCDIEVFLKDRISFFYGKSETEVISIEAPGWFKSAVGEDNWDYVKSQIENKAEIMYDGYNGMELPINY
jgi:hypothetical protein